MDSLTKFAFLIVFRVLFRTGVFGEPRRRAVPPTAGAQHVNPPTPQPVAPASGAYPVQQSAAQPATLSDDDERRLPDLSDVLVGRRGRGSGRRRQRSGPKGRESSGAVGDGSPVYYARPQTGCSSADADS